MMSSHLLFSNIIYYQSMLHGSILQTFLVRLVYTIKVSACDHGRNQPFYASARLFTIILLTVGTVIIMALLRL